MLRADRFERREPRARLAPCGRRAHRAAADRARRAQGQFKPRECSVVSACAGHKGQRLRRAGCMAKSRVHASSVFTRHNVCARAVAPCAVDDPPLGRGRTAWHTCDGRHHRMRVANTASAEDRYRSHEHVAWTCVRSSRVPLREAASRGQRDDSATVTIETAAHGAITAARARLSPHITSAHC